LGGFFLFVFVIVLIAAYFLPTIIAFRRGRQVGPVTVINTFFGWSLIGWVVAISMALSDKSNGVGSAIHQTIVMQQGPTPQNSIDTSISE
jgi:hypothetical protein